MRSAPVAIAAGFARNLPGSARARVCLAACAGLALAGCGTARAPNTPKSPIGAQQSTLRTASKHICQPAHEPVPSEGKHERKPRLGLDREGTYIVTLWTNCGAIRIQLDVVDSPKTTASFASLVNDGFYNGLTFHNVVAGLDIQGGDPDEDGLGGPGYVVIEKPPLDTRYTRGTVAMARNVPGPVGASGSQFFIVTSRHADLPPQYPVVGRVIGGYAAINLISRVPTDPSGDGSPDRAIVIWEATISVG